MRLADLVEGAAHGEARITGFAIDHRKVAPGNVFGAFQGAAVNGEDFIPAAVAGGAIAVVARPEAQVSGALHIADAVPRRAFARLAAKFFQPVPANVVAVTGTNGKTSTAEMVRQIWRMSGHRAASIGTLGVTTSDESISTGLTTPDIVTFLGNMTPIWRTISPPRCACFPKWLTMAARRWCGRMMNGPRALSRRLRRAG